MNCILRIYWKNRIPLDIFHGLYRSSDGLELYSETLIVPWWDSNPSRLGVKLNLYHCTLNASVQFCQLFQYILSLGILGFPRPNSQHVQQRIQRRPLACILVSTRLVPYTICLMNSPPIGWTSSQHTVCLPTKCVIGYSAPTGNWRVKLGNGKLSLGFVEAIKVFYCNF